MKEKLKECPFCGGEAKMRHTVTVTYDYGLYETRNPSSAMYGVQCTSCGCEPFKIFGGLKSSERMETRQKAVAAWNARAADENF